MNNFLAVLEFYVDNNKNVKFKTINFSGQTNILCRRSFFDIVKIPQKFLPLPMLEITTIPVYFLPTREKIPILWIELQTNKNIKSLKTLHTSKHREVRNSRIAKM